ncbi:hypothetical protein GPX89_34490 [Nocardia sp. ET3-3]|uniref:Uncharacterized protein n=1 Tax=Nocardia terrae TaxID=2675851 RepID=A0A7K1V784_9NOCA|nr:hypothetical protein [Nocardia terrae]MVU82331.1 hypothetical protein [Nocardia terrae]
MTESAASEVVSLDQSEVETIYVLASKYGVTIEELPRLGAEPVTLVTVILVGGSTAIACVLRALDQRRGGQVIDLRAGARKKFFRTPDVAFGTFVIIAADGSVTVRVKEPDRTLGKLLSTLPEILPGGGSVRDAATAVCGAFEQEVELEPGDCRQTEAG